MATVKDIPFMFSEVLKESLLREFIIHYTLYKMMMRGDDISDYRGYEEDDDK